MAAVTSLAAGRQAVKKVTDSAQPANDAAIPDGARDYTRCASGG